MCGFFCGRAIRIAEIKRPPQRETSMSTAKKKPASKKKSEPKKAGFIPKIKSTKRNGIGTY